MKGGKGFGFGVLGFWKGYEVGDHDWDLGGRLYGHDRQKGICQISVLWICNCMDMIQIHGMGKETRFCYTRNPKKKKIIIIIIIILRNNIIIFLYDIFFFLERISNYDIYS